MEKPSINCVVKSETLTVGELEKVRKQVREWEERGYLKMAILYHLGQNYTVSGSYEPNGFVITLS